MLVHAVDPVEAAGTSTRLVSTRLQLVILFYLLDKKMKVFRTILAEVARMPELPLLVVVDNIFVLVHAADPVKAAAAKVADVRPDLVVRVTDVKLLLGKHFIVGG